MVVGMSSKQGEVASAALGVPFSSNQHRIGRATKQASRGQITQAKYETDVSLPNFLMI